MQPRDEANMNDRDVRGSSSVVELLVANEKVAGSNPVSRSMVRRGRQRQNLVREEGVEPSRVSPLAPKASASANSATLAKK
jgi:hypothetical protein